MRIQITNETKSHVIAPRARVAQSFLRRCLGLLGSSTLPEGEGLWITPCRSVHTFFMRYPIDVIFLDEAGVVLSATTLPPWRFSRYERRAIGALELSAGAITRSRTEVGDQFILRSN